MKRQQIHIVLMIAVVALAGCGSAPQAPVDPFAEAAARVVSQTSIDAVIKETGRALDSLLAVSPEAIKPTVQAICRALVDANRRADAIEVIGLAYGYDLSENQEIASRLLTSTLLPGQLAPPITANDGATIHPGSGSQQTILFFYESRCRSCQAMISRIIDSYGELQEAGVRVITLSSDTDRKLFAEYSRKFPWVDKLCDYAGFGSPSFINYGVAGTPAMFLIDEKGMVTDQYESINELLEVITHKNK